MAIVHFRPLIVCLVLSIIFLMGVIWTVRPEPSWVGFGSPEATLSKQAIEKALLESKTSDGLARAGLRIPIVWFRTPENRVIRVTLREMSFEDDRIDGFRIPPDQRAAIVSSVDQKVYVSSGSSGPILQGCALTRLDGRAMLPGSIDVMPCQGVYSKLGIASIINVAIVTFSNDQLDVPPCFSQLYEQQGDKGYQECMLEQLRSGIGSIIAAKEGGNAFDLLILPELTTGHGGLSKRQFYATLFSLLANKLSDATARKQLPSEIVLQVWHQDRPGSFLQTIDGIRREIDGSVEAFSKIDHPARSISWLRLAGIAGGLSLAISGMLIFPRLQAVFPALQSLASAPTATSLLAWIVICFGLADSLYGLAGSATPPWEEYTQLGLGVLIVPIAAPVIKALKSVQDSITG